MAEQGGPSEWPHQEKPHPETQQQFTASKENGMENEVT